MPRTGGIHVIIEHGYGYETLYAHLDELKVRKGQVVKRGDLTGLVGNTGLSAGPHLHYEAGAQRTASTWTPPTSTSTT